MLSGGPVRLHPRDCNDRFCASGVAVPLQRATDLDVARAVLGDIYNEVGLELEVSIRYRLPAGEHVQRARLMEVIVTGDGLTWTLDEPLLEETGIRRWQL